jgi:hypothetical protein
MAVYNWGVDKTFIADVDMNTAQYKFVTAASTGDRYVKAATVAGGSSFGVLQNDPRAGEEATVRVWGFTKVMANANASALAFAKFVKSGSDGMACGAANLAASDNALGMSMETLTSGSGIYVEVLLQPAMGFRA